MSGHLKCFSHNFKLHASWSCDDANEMVLFHIIVCRWCSEKMHFIDSKDQLNLEHSKALKLSILK